MAGGGTGGHIYPALAIARGIMQRWPDSEILFVGTAEGMESRIVPESGFAIKSISAAGLDRSSLLKALGSALKVPIGFWQARGIISEFKPDVVIGTGGYVSYPVVLAGSILRVKTVIHEQNAYPGLANRALAQRADYVLLTFPEAADHLPKAPTRVTGLPVRPEFSRITREQAQTFFDLKRDRFTLVVFGGSRGAASINKAIMGIISKYRSSQVQIVWVTGEQHYDKIIKKLTAEGSPAHVKVYPYLYNMEFALAIADLAVCRAGAATISELAVCGVPAIFVPYPYAAENHQEKNARSLEKKGAAVTIIDEFLDEQILFQKIEELRGNKFKLLKMSQLMKAEGRPRALEEILNVVEKLVLGSQHNP
jgi:UDP-N-acetylglucosamine--N-acetylmuramyl-(pentapeptide) pyrophosphoryl-undecaprenol N-acetylglucosamine transferase